jgi:hypothetical protein
VGSADGSVVSLDRPDGALAGVLRLDPAVWRAAVCSTLAGAESDGAESDGAESDRALGADDRAGLPRGPVCADRAAPPR